jgi:hypothetical protein
LERTITNQADSVEEHQFEVVARAYYKLQSMGLKPKIALLVIGRTEFHLDNNVMNRARLRAEHFVKKHGLPKDVDDKRFIHAPRMSEAA